MKRFLLGILTGSLCLSGTALAADEPDPSLDGIVQDDSDDEEDDDDSLDALLDDILQTSPESVSRELEDVRTEVPSMPLATPEVVLPETERKRRIIKTIQKKNFIKMGRFEVTPNVSFVTNDPFLNRYIVGTNLGYNFTEIFEVELNLGFSPILGEADWKPLTDQLVNNNHVSPDLSPLNYFGNTTFAFSPIYGKVAVLGSRIINFDIFGAFGMGVVRTVDDLNALQAENDPRAIATQSQLHPTTNFGGGLRVALGDSTAIRLEGRSLVYIETVSSVTLEMKNNFILQGGVSFFFPGMD